MQRTIFTLILLLVAAFTLATHLQSLFLRMSGNRLEAASVLEILLGDSRRMFGVHFFQKADGYFHVGKYPSIFEQAAAGPLKIAEQAGLAEATESCPEEARGGRALDWLDRFGRSFHPSGHAHLGDAGHPHDPGSQQPRTEQGDVRELLPWLRLSVEMDPYRIETYVVTAYWLRDRMGKVNEAEEFLREGLRHNPGNYLILFELGKIFEENRNDGARARNVWELALQKWKEQEGPKADPDTFTLAQICSRLALLEERENNLQAAIGHLEELKKVSPSPQRIQLWIDEHKARLADPPDASQTK